VDLPHARASVNCRPARRRVLDAALRDDFGFRHLLWVFSGRRGVHCWVCDAGARALPNEARSAVAAYLTVAAGGEGRAKKVSGLTWPLHASLARAYAALEPAFRRRILCEEGGQGLLEEPESWRKVGYSIQYNQ
jgi:DNA primase small subunit